MASGAGNTELEDLYEKDASILHMVREIPSILPKGDYSAVLLASFGVNVLALALPVMTLQVYDRILVNGSIETMTVLAIGVVIAVALEWMLRISRSYIMGMSGVHFETVASEEALRKVVKLDLKAAQKHEAGEYLEGLSSISRLRDFYSGQLVTSFVDMPFILIYLFLIAYLAGSMVLVPIALLLLFGGVVWACGRSLRDLVRQKEETDAFRYSQIIEILTGLHTVKGLALESKAQRLYERSLVDAAHKEYALSITGGLTNMLGGIMSQIMMVAVVVAGAPTVIKGDISMGALIACLLLAGRLTQPLMRALSLWANFQEVRLAREQMEELFQFEKDVPSLGLLNEKERAVLPVAPQANERVCGAVELANISFRYEDNSRWLLRNVEMKIEAGEFICLMGGDGTAKTAFLELLAGLYNPDEGRILIDGQTIDSLTPNAARHIAYVPSDAVIFRGSILENICQFNAAYETQARQLAAWMGIETDVAKLPMGYETPLTPSGHGEEISPGLRQRVAIVRALSPHPRLILLDNADHALDRKGYNHLFELLAQLKGIATIVAVTDDHNIMRLSDRKLTIHNGAFWGAVAAS